MASNPIRLRPRFRIRALGRNLASIFQAMQNRLRRLATPRQIRRYDKLHLGSGARLLDGWGNVDINGLGTLVWDLRKPLPLPDGRVRLVYTEHFIEHIAREDAVKLLSHARKVMAPGAVLRVSTPDLRKLASDYIEDRIVRMEHGGWYPQSPCQMINEGMRMWGHVYLYDQAELTGLLRECGFAEVRRLNWGESEHAELRNLESRPDFGDLILEARA
jgi:predicted SAM-dependent methyltransferase